MKIAYTISGLYNSGGMENILIQKVNYLAEVFNHEVTIITTDQKGLPPFFNISPKVNLIDLGLNYAHKEGFSVSWLLKRFFLKKKHMRVLSKCLIENKFDIVVSLMDYDFDFLYKINDGSKKILESHFEKYYKVHDTKSQLIKLLQKIRVNSWSRIVLKYDLFVVLTNEDKNQWGNLTNIQVIPNFIKTVPQSKSNLNTHRVLSVGRAEFQKGYDMLIEAWKIVKDTFPEWELRIVGGGNKSYLLKKIKKLGLEAEVQLMPPTKKIEKEYLESSVYVLSSRFEGLPLVLLEAMSYGLPIVSFACPCGPKDILKDEFGKLIECNNIERLAEGIIYWLKNLDARKIAGVAAQKEAIKYSKSEIMNKWNEVFNKILNG